MCWTSGVRKGSFRFEAERRGAREVIGIDSFPDSVRRFNIVKEARQSAATAFLMSVYDLRPGGWAPSASCCSMESSIHLKHPQCALERIRSVRNALFQTYNLEEPTLKGTPWARYYRMA